MKIVSIPAVALAVCTSVLLLSCEGELDDGLADAAPANKDSGPNKVFDGGKVPDLGKPGDKGKPTPDKGMDKGKDKAPPPKDTGGTFTGKPGEFVRTHGGRSYRLLVPSGYKHSKPIPLLVAFHGSGDSGGNFFAICKYVGYSTATQPANFILLVPDTKSPYKDFALWSGNPSNDVGQMKQEMGQILAIIQALAKQFNIDQKRVHALGFSNGGLFTAVAGMHYAAKFASLTVAGYGWGAFYPLVTPARKIPVQLLCGSTDSFHAKAQQSEGYLKSMGHPTRLLTASGVGHKFSGLNQKHPPSSLFQWMAKYTAP